MFGEFYKFSIKISIIFYSNFTLGKTLQNVFKYKNYKFRTPNDDTHDRRRKSAARLFASPKFQNATIISKDIVLIEAKQSSVTFDKLTLTAFSILEISKLVLTNHIYSMKRMFESVGGSMELLLTGKFENFYLFHEKVHFFFLLLFFNLRHRLSLCISEKY